MQKVLAHLKYGDSCPEDVVEVFPVTFTTRMCFHDFRTSAISCPFQFVCVFAKLTAKQVHPKYAVKNIYRVIETQNRHSGPQFVCTSIS